MQRYDTGKFSHQVWLCWSSKQISSTSISKILNPPVTMETCVSWMQIVFADMRIKEETSECWEDLFSRSAISSYIQYSLMLASGFNGAKYIVYLNDGNLLAEAGSFQKYSDALTCFNQTVSLGSFGRWKEVYLEGYDRAGQFIDLYQFHSFSYNYWNTFSVDIVKSDHFCKVVSSCCLIFIWFGAEEITSLQG